jgi:hypothetical protein
MLKWKLNKGATGVKKDRATENHSIFASPLLLREMDTLCKLDLFDRKETETMTCEEFVEKHQASCAERLSFLYLLIVRDQNNAVRGSYFLSFSRLISNRARILDWHPDKDDCRGNHEGFYRSADYFVECVDERSFGICGGAWDARLCNREVGRGSRTECVETMTGAY